MTLALLCQFTAQHILDVNTSIFRSLRLIGALLCGLYCAVMIEVYVIIYLSIGKFYTYIICRVLLWVSVFLQKCGALWLLNVFVWYILVLYASVLMTICMSCTYPTWGVLVLCSGIVCWWFGIRMRLSHYWPVHCGAWGFEGLGVYDRLEQGVCIAWALLRNVFSIVVEGLDMVLFIWQE